MLLRPPPLLTIVPGLLSATVLAGAAHLAASIEQAVIQRTWADSLVLAIAMGTAIRTLFGLHPIFEPGVRFAAKTVLELAIVLLGASASMGMIIDAGLGSVTLVFSLVLLSLGVSYGIGRALGLSRSLATLVACGNSICGNSAIVAVAPVIGAKSDDIASSIAFTATLGIAVILVLPLATHLIPLSEQHYGIIAGMTVYAVPQVLAATSPIGPVALQVGTVIKLLRVLMLGPVIILVGLTRRNGERTSLNLGQVLPWFVIGFFVLIVTRSMGWIPVAAVVHLKAAESLLTLIAMAALGLAVDLRSVLASGGRVFLAGTLSIAALATMTCAALFLIPSL